MRLFHCTVHIIASRIAGLSDEDGWQKPSVNFDRVFVPTEHSLEFLRQSKYPMERVVLAGMPRMDAVIKSQSDELETQQFFRSIRLPLGAPYIVLNVEPSAEHNYASWDQHWRLFR